VYAVELVGRQRVRRRWSHEAIACEHACERLEEVRQAAVGHPGGDQPLGRRRGGDLQSCVLAQELAPHVERRSLAVALADERSRIFQQHPTAARIARDELRDGLRGEELEQPQLKRQRRDVRLEPEQSVLGGNACDGSPRPNV
jgi:hypothetical protein